MTTSSNHRSRIAALILLIAVGLAIALVPSAALADSASAASPIAQDGSDLEEDIEAIDVPKAVGENESFTVDATAVEERDDVADACWKFDENDECHDAETTHSFAEVRYHTATLVVTDADGDHMANTELIVVTTPPTAGLEAPESVEAGSEATFDASGSTDDHEIAAYEWDLDGDGTVDETTSTPELVHAFESTGTVEVTVTTVDAADQVDTATATVEVVEQNEDDESEEAGNDEGDDSTGDGDESDGIDDEKNGTDENDVEDTETKSDEQRTTPGLIGIAVAGISVLAVGTFVLARYKD